MESASSDPQCSEDDTSTIRTVPSPSKVDSRAETPSRPRTAIADVQSTRPAPVTPVRGNTPIRTMISRFESEMQNRSRPRNSMNSAESIRPSVFDTRSLQSAGQSQLPFTPPDNEVSAILRATAPHGLLYSPSPNSKEQYSQDAALSSHHYLSLPSSPPPLGPLPELPVGESVRRASKEVDVQSKDTKSDTTSDDALVHPLFRPSIDQPPESRPTPSEKSLPDSLLELRNETMLRQLPGVSKTSYQADAFHAAGEMPSKGTVTRPSTAGTFQSASDSSLQERLGATIIASGFSSISSRNQERATLGSREERTRARKLRHLKTIDIRPKPLPTPQPSPTSTKPASSIFNSKAYVDSPPDEFVLSSIVSTIDQPPVTPLKSAHGAQPFMSQGVHQDSEANVPKPSRQPTMAECSQSRTLPTNSPANDEEAVGEMHALRISPLDTVSDRSRGSSGAELTNTSRISQSSLVGRPIVASNQRMSFSSTDRAMSMTSQTSSAPGNAPSEAARSQTSSRSHTRPSRSLLQTRISHLERQNSLLEAALMAVLKTGGLLNGCPCQAEGKINGSDMLRETLSYRSLSASDSTSLRESVLIDAAMQAQAQVQSHETAAKRSSAATITSTGNKVTNKVTANVGASRERGELKENGLRRGDSKALALFLATKLDLGARVAADLNGESTDTGVEHGQRVRSTHSA